MENGKKLTLLAGAAVLLLAAGFGGWKYWRGHQAVTVARMALDGEPGRQLAGGIMDKMYGKGAYDGKGKCWNIDHAVAKGEEPATYCMKPLALDRVRVAGEERLYLFAGAGRPDAGHAESEALIGAFVVDAGTQSLIAGNRALSFLNGFAGAPSGVKLLQLSATGYMAWFAEGEDMHQGIAAGYPQLYAPKGRKVVEISGELFGKDENMAEGLSFDYEADAAQADAKVFPLLLKISDDKHKPVASFRFRFDSPKWQYVCADQACRKKTGIPAAQPMSLKDDDNAAPPPPANANAALFGADAGLAADDLKDVLAALGASYVVNNNGWGFVTGRCRTPFQLSASYPADEKDSHNELWVRGGDACTSGADGQSIWLFIRGDDGHLRANLGVPAIKTTVTGDANDGRYDLRLSGIGFCDTIWRWDGSRYQHLKNIAARPGGCDSDAGAQRQ
ncbi:hypothetical protein CXB49_20370 [Chromobacterium sp. ATCC 53434]|uniref:hypothetical protein n=1 Tax=Chromobacterium TaxID=535 RepID=UPI000C75B603|nr:hypothetical protein [Chromobacterium sp. ATCC 53434]AUH52973.1 hypothetical protein CXB49_20370 [Chromobacterium sp. ATCC 53434]